VFRRYTGEPKKPAAEPPPPPKKVERPAAMDASFIDLGELLRDDDRPKSTRMIVEEQAPTGDEQADFADMLRRFKQGVAENVEEEDHQSHYDLGVAYKEMGLLDEAIAEFQKALRGPENRVRAYEAIGQCFLEKSQFQVAATLLGRALLEPNHDDEQLVGVLYLLGYCSEALQLWSDAIRYYQRVAAVDIQFRDVSERISSLERVAK
jgi:tetratricopeptide (TPR) repeat protein